MTRVLVVHWNDVAYVLAMVLIVFSPSTLSGDEVQTRLRTQQYVSTLMSYPLRS